MLVHLVTSLNAKQAQGRGDAPPQCFFAHFEREFSGVVEPSGKELEKKKSRCTDEQIAFALKQAETGTPVAEVIRRIEISELTFYR